MVDNILEGVQVFEPSQNIWTLIPSLKYFPPYNKLYDRDSSKSKEDSSKEMWCIIFLTHPDEEKNIFFRRSPEERKKAIKEGVYKKIDWNDELVKECEDSFPEDLLTSAQRSLKIELDALRKRANYLRDTDITEDTARTYNMIQKDSFRVYEGYEKVKDKFLEEKAQIRAKGGRRLSKAERGELWGKKQ